jgi:single-strand DNA-binding protein
MRKCELVGIVGERVELKNAGGTDVLNFSVVANGSRKEDEGQWHSCALFGTRATKLVEYIKKGKKVFIRGEYKLRSWAKGEKSGVDVDVTVDEIELLSPKETSDEAPKRNW